MKKPTKKILGLTSSLLIAGALVGCGADDGGQEGQAYGGNTIGTQGTGTQYDVGTQDVRTPGFANKNTGTQATRFGALETNDTNDVVDTDDTDDVDNTENTADNGGNGETEASGYDFKAYFDDIAEDYWAVEQIEWSKDKEILLGSDDNFRPSEGFTRAQAAVVFHRLAELGYINVDADPETEEPATDPEAEEPATDPEAEEPATDPEAEEPATDPEAEEPATTPAT